MVSLLRRWRSARRQEILEPGRIAIDGREIEVKFKRHRRARRLIVRLDRRGESVAVTLPPRASRDEALEFVSRSRSWIATRLAGQPQAVALRTWRGDHAARHRAMSSSMNQIAAASSAMRPTHTVFVVPGDATHLKRRVTDWLKREAKRELLAASERHAQAMGVDFRKLSIRDQASRWGSCSADGRLSYSWRLILAPPHVLDYVAVHEVAHLKHMNHGVRFWRLVLTHCPEAACRRAPGSGATARSSTVSVSNLP